MTRSDTVGYGMAGRTRFLTLPEDTKAQSMYLQTLRLTTEEVE